MTTPKFNEDTLSEKPAIEQLVRMGYEFVPGDKLDPQEVEDSERTSRRDVRHSHAPHRLLRDHIEGPGNRRFDGRRVGPLNLHRQKR